jgi:acyl transferase domain-containing protein
VGDPVEYESVRLALTGSGRDGDLLLGSVKDNIGHTEAASGVAGVIKVLLMMQYKTVPKQANFISLNPLIKASSEIIVPKTTRPWTASGEHVALVNNYGAAGSNAALLLRSHAEASLGSREYQVRSSAIYPVLLSAKTASHLQAYTDALKSYLPKVEASFGSVAYKISRSHNLSFEHRLAFTATDAETAVSILNSSSTTMLETATRTTRLPIVLCFGGQTGQTVRISKELYDSCHPFRYHLVSASEPHRYCMLTHKCRKNVMLSARLLASPASSLAFSKVMLSKISCLSTACFCLSKYHQLNAG